MNIRDRGKMGTSIPLLVGQHEPEPELVEANDTVGYS